MKLNERLGRDKLKFGLLGGQICCNPNVNLAMALKCTPE
jgi:hypothetical protein